MEGICVPLDWERLTPETLTGTVLVVGAVDAGKSSFVRWLAGRLCGKDTSAFQSEADPKDDASRNAPPGVGPGLEQSSGSCPGIRLDSPTPVETAPRGARLIAWIDGDIGQPALGPPACQHLALLGGQGVEFDEGRATTPSDEPARADERHPSPPLPVASFFVGSVTPMGRLLPTLVGVKRLHERALAAGAGTVLVDTSGFVAERAGGAALKEWIVELLRPSLVVALVRGAELDHLLAPLARDRRVRLAVLPVCEAVRRRSPEKRAERRARQFRQLFAAPVRLDVRLDELAVWGLESAGHLSLGALLGVDGFVLALCLLLERRGNNLSLLLSRAVAPAQAVALRFGALRLDPATGLALSS